MNGCIVSSEILPVDLKKKMDSRGQGRSQTLGFVGGGAELKIRFLEVFF